jgi:hypothetical protein
MTICLYAEASLGCPDHCQWIGLVLAGCRGTTVFGVKMAAISAFSSVFRIAPPEGRGEALVNLVAVRP